MICNLLVHIAYLLYWCIILFMKLGVLFETFTDLYLYIFIYFLCFQIIDINLKSYYFELVN